MQMWTARLLDWKCNRTGQDSVDCLARRGDFARRSVWLRASLVPAFLTTAKPSCDDSWQTDRTGSPSSFVCFCFCLKCFSVGVGGANRSASSSPIRYSLGYVSWIVRCRIRSGQFGVATSLWTTTTNRQSQPRSNIYLFLHATECSGWKDKPTIRASIATRFLRAPAASAWPSSRPLRHCFGRHGRALTAGAHQFCTRLQHKKTPLASLFTTSQQSVIYYCQFLILFCFFILTFFLFSLLSTMLFCFILSFKTRRIVAKITDTIEESFAVIGDWDRFDWQCFEWENRLSDSESLVLIFIAPNCAVYLLLLLSSLDNVITIGTVPFFSVLHKFLSCRQRI